MSFFSALLGFDGANRMKNEAEQRAGTGYANATANQDAFKNQYLTGSANATNTLNQAGSQYGNMANQGNSIYGGLFNDYLKTTGYNGAYSLPQPPQPAGGNRTTPGTGGAAAVLNRNSPGALPQQPTAQGTPYDLTQAQQAQLNQMVDRHSTAANNAIQEYRAQLAQTGQLPNAAGEAEIASRFTQLAEEAKSNFAESARKDRENALNNLLQQGLQQQQAGAGGQANVAQLQNQFASNPALLNLAGQQQNQANIDTQTQAQQMAAGNIGQQFLGAASSLGGAFLGGGGFNPYAELLNQLKPKKTTSTSKTMGAIQTVDPLYGLLQNNYMLD
jgi:hypothetical protein